MNVSNRRIVILGKTGAGKSSLANTIFGENVFTTAHTPISETTKCEAETRSVNGRSITLIDTPGFFDTGRSEEEVKPEIVRCITECAPGPHAFLIVLKVEKFTKQETEVITEIHQCFSEEVFKYTTVVFTHGDQLLEGQTIEKFVDQSKHLSDLVKKCGSRYHVIDNKYWNGNPKDEYRSNQFQVEKLLQSIEKTLLANKGSCYTNDTLQAMEEEIQQEEEHIRLLAGNISENEMREQAKVRVFKKLLIKLAGITTGTLLGAFFGVSAMAACVVVLLKTTSESDLLRQAVAAPVAKAAGALTLASAAAGAVIGGVKGYHAAEGADTPQEAAKMAAEAVQNEVLYVLDKGKDVLDRVSQRKSKQSQNLY